jgi:hypothetical protein
MNWHEPLITPAMAFYCFIGVIVIDVLYLVVRKAIREARESDTDPYSDPAGDWPRDPRSR